MPLFSRRRLFAGSAAFSAVASVFGLRSASARYYDGPVSDHFDGTRFFDLHGPTPRTLGEQLRWWREGGRVQWPDWAPSPYSDKPPARVTSDAWRISFVGHASFLIQSAGLNILIDPVWSQRCSPVSFAGPKRVNDPGIPFDALPRIDAVLVSHCHYDHLDVETISRLHAAHRPRVIVPLGNDAIIRDYHSNVRTEAFDWHQRVALGPNFAVTLIPTRHWSARGLTDRNKALWASFVFDTPAGRIYHVADSGYGDGQHFRAARDRYGPFRLTILPIGAYEPRWFMSDMHMNPEEAVRAFQVCGAEFALGHHYGTFQLTNEAIDAPIEALIKARVEAGIEPERFRLLKPGQIWEVHAKAVA
jgi:L-ascorbate metabolism protein UlaG (beta-lactamase superfamily)